ncbi:hypothetical protein QTP88_022546 [Uroleucon formosanum]
MSYYFLYAYCILNSHESKYFLKQTMTGNHVLMVQNNEKLVHRAHFPTMCEYYTFGIILKPFAYYQKNMAFIAISPIVLRLENLSEGGVSEDLIMSPVQYSHTYLDWCGVLIDFSAIFLPVDSLTSSSLHVGNGCVVAPSKSSCVHCGTVINSVYAFPNRYHKSLTVYNRKAGIIRR